MHRASRVALWAMVFVPLPAAGQENAEGQATESAEPAELVVAPAEAPSPGLSLADALHALSDPSAANRQAAIMRLSELGDRTAVPNLMFVLRQDPDAETRRHAAVALANLGDRAAVPALQEAASQDPAEPVRRTAAEAVARLGGSVPTPATVFTPVPPPPVPTPPLPPAAPAVAGTEFVFHSEEPGVEVHRVVAEHTIWIGGNPGHYGSAQSFELLCRTPCRATLPNGSYTLLADGYEFDVEAGGGTQSWEVEGRNGFGYWTGFWLTILGGCFGLAGGLLLGIMGTDDPMTFDMNLGFLLGGLGGMAIGIPLWILSDGDAERTTGTAGWGFRSLTVGLAPHRSPEGRSALGLALGFTL